MATVILVILGIFVAPIYGVGKLIEWYHVKEREKEIRKSKEPGKSVKLCSDCGVVNNEDAKYCGKCGSKLSEGIEKCSNSGAELEPRGGVEKKGEKIIKGFGSFLLGLFYWGVFSFFAAFSSWEYVPHVLKMLSFTVMIFGPILYWIVFPLKERWHDKGKRKRFYAIMTPIGIIFLIFLGAAFLPP